MFIVMSDDDDIINIDTKLPTIRRCEVPSDYTEPAAAGRLSDKPSLKRSMPEHVAARRDHATESNYSPKKKRMLEHINTEYNGSSESNGGGEGEGLTPTTDILSPKYNHETSSPTQGLLSPSPLGTYIEFEESAVVLYTSPECIISTIAYQLDAIIDPIIS